MDFGIVCACLPCLKPLVKHYYPNLAFFDARVEQRVVSSFRFSNRVAHFNQPSVDHGCDGSGSTWPAAEPGNAAASSNVLRPKPSVGSGSSEEQGMRDEKVASHHTHSSTLVPSSDARSADSRV